MWNEKITTFTDSSKQQYTIFFYKRCYYAVKTYDDFYLNYEFLCRDYQKEQNFVFGIYRRYPTKGFFEFRFTVMNKSKESSWFYCWRIGKSRLDLMAFLSEVSK